MNLTALRQALCTLSIISVPAFSVAQLSQSDLLEDFDQCKRLIQTIHSNRYAYISQSEFEAFTETQRSQIDSNTSFQEFYNLIAETISYLKCYHSGTSLPSDKEFDKYWPLTTYFDGAKLSVVKGHASGSSIPAASEIIEINGEAVASVIENLRKRINVDGGIESAIRMRLSDDFHQLYATHYTFPDSYQIKFRRPNQTEAASIILEAVPNDQRQFERGSVWPTSSGDWGLDFRFLSGDDTAIMTVKHFGYYNNQSLFNDFVENSFVEMKTKQTQNLILDLRRNGGGDPLAGNKLLSYLAREPYVYFENGNGYPSLLRSTTPATERFTGKAYLLVDGKIGSTAGHFVSLVRYLDLATFVGEGTGATYFCSGNSATRTLSNSRIQIRLGQGTYSTAVTGIERGKAIEPDLPFSPDIEQVVADRDAMLDFLLNTIDNIETETDPPSAGIVSRPFGARFVFETIANPGYKFKEWLEIKSSTDNPVTLPNENRTNFSLTAIYEKDEIDEDRDGLSNYLEQAVFYSAINSMDTDGDSISDGDEALLAELGFDPLVNDSAKVNSLVANSSLIAQIVSQEIGDNPIQEVKLDGLSISQNDDGKYSARFQLQTFDENQQWIDTQETFEVEFDPPENGNHFIRIQASAL